LQFNEKDWSRGGIGPSIDPEICHLFEIVVGGNHAAPPQFQASAPLSARFNNRTHLRLFHRTFSSYQCHVSNKNTQRCYMSFPPEDMELVINIIWIYSLLLSNFLKNILWSLDLFNKNKVSLIFFKYEN
jgi:hypothetical protein